MSEEDDEEAMQGDFSAKKAAGVWTEFDCPLCDANNPLSEGFGVGDEVTCMFCGCPLRVKAKDDGFRLVE